MKKINTCILFLIMLVLLLSFPGCSNRPAKQDNKNMKLPVTVSILPQKYFLERIAGDHVAISVMIPPGHNPATYEPTPQQLQDLSHSKLYFRIGHIPFEKRWIPNFSSLNPAMNIIDTSQGVSLITPLAEEEHEENHAAEHEHGSDHHHKGTDPHIWLSPNAVKIQAGHIRDALVATDPGKKDEYEKNYQNFVRDINELEKEMKAILSELKGKKFLVFHPAWGYLARDFGLEQVAIETEGKEPGPADLKRVIDVARSENIRVIFVQSQFSIHSAQAAADEIGGQVVQLDPLSPDWLDNMKTIAQAFRDAVQHPSTSTSTGDR